MWSPSRLITVLALATACQSTPTSTAPGTPTAAQAADHNTHTKVPAEHGPDESAKPAMYACPMHPDVTASEPGECHKCGMALVADKKHDHGAHEHQAAPPKTGDGHEGHGH